jgi:hypothetical protein
MSPVPQLSLQGANHRRGPPEFVFICYLSLPLSRPRRCGGFTFLSLCSGNGDIGEQGEASIGTSQAIKELSSG